MPPSPTTSVPGHRRPYSSRSARNMGGSICAPKNEIRPIYWKDDCLFVLDQRALPHRETYIRCRDAGSVARAITGMALRGAPLIGGAAAYGFALAAKSLTRANRASWSSKIEAAGRLLRESRPTAVNLMV